jgi:hypothetical protein
METLKNIINFFLYFILTFCITLGGMMEFFGNPYGKYILIPSIIIGCYELYKNDK